jgi:hypothetical protein
MHVCAPNHPGGGEFFASANAQAADEWLRVDGVRRDNALLRYLILWAVLFSDESTLLASAQVAVPFEVARCSPARASLASCRAVRESSPRLD